MIAYLVSFKLIYIFITVTIHMQLDDKFVKIMIFVDEIHINCDYSTKNTIYRGYQRVFMKLILKKVHYRNKFDWYS